MAKISKLDNAQTAVKNIVILTQNLSSETLGLR